MNSKAFIPPILLIVVTLASACFITNCPKSGKRSMDAGIPPRDCMPCGPEGRGRCHGPDICCIPELGCYIKSPESFMCKLEALNPRPCKAPGPSCGADGQGTCGAQGVCCSNDSCTSDKTCFRKESTSLFYESFPRFAPEIYAEQH